MAVRAPAQPRRRAASRPPLRVVKGRGKGHRKGRRFSPIPVILCVILTVFGVTALHATMSQNGFKAAKLEREVQQEMERLTLQRARVAQLSNAGRIADEATKLGLVGDPDATFLKVPLDTPSDVRPVAPGQPSRDPIKTLGSGAR
jgi:hypothetical protein